jgi:hypothetical protein
MSPCEGGGVVMDTGAPAGTTPVEAEREREATPGPQGASTRTTGGGTTVPAEGARDPDPAISPVFTVEL